MTWEQEEIIRQEKWKAKARDKFINKQLLNTNTLDLYGQKNKILHKPSYVILDEACTEEIDYNMINFNITNNIVNIFFPNSSSMS